MGDDLASRVKGAVIEPLVAEGAVLEEVVIAGSRKKPVIRIVVDADGGLTLDQAAEINRACSRALDEGDVMGDQSYVVEVTSPGVSRPLTAERNWRRNIGRLVRVQPQNNGEVITGRITAVDRSTVTLEMAGKHRDVRYEDVKKAVVQVELKRGEG